jgi:YVTN family beta-propeller protein
MKLLKIALVLCFLASSAFAANIGTVVPVIGTVADLIYDSARNVVYLANSTGNRVEIYSVDGARLIGSIQTGLQPGSLALSPDGNTLYVANLGSLSVSVVSLISQQVVTDYPIGSRPDAIAIGNDGKVVILGTAGLLRLDTSNGTVTAVPITPPPTPAAGLPNIPNSPTPVGATAGLITTASGNLIIGLSVQLAAPRLFVYEVASGTVLRSRNVTGLRAILSAATDGSRFMAGPFLFDTQTLTILGRAGIINAALTGGSAFSVDGNAVYGYFST